MRALPLGVAVKRRVHYFSLFLLLLLGHILFSQKGFSKGSEILHGVLSKKKLTGVGKNWGFFRVKKERKLFRIARNGR